MTTRPGNARMQAQTSGQATAVFAHFQTESDRAPVPYYDVIDPDGHTGGFHRSTKSAAGLRELGIAIPHTPAFDALAANRDRDAAIARMAALFALPMCEGVA